MIRSSIAISDQAVRLEYVPHLFLRFRFRAVERYPPHRVFIQHLFSSMEGPMPTLNFARLRSYAAEHPAVRNTKEISVWAWIAGVVLVLTVLAAATSPSLRDKNGPINHPLLPLASESGLDIPNPNI
jgi:hypothetical protein